MNDVLEVEGIVAGYGQLRVLRGVSLTAGAGRMVAVLGPNGAGKSTLMKVIAGTLPHEAGTITFDGEVCARRGSTHRARRGMCFIPEGRAVFRHLCVRENIAMFVGGRDVDRAVDRAVASFPSLGRRLRQIAGTLSGGEQQMLALCRPLLTSPRLVIADEPSLGLAPMIVDQVFGVLDELRRDGAAVVVVEQYAQLILTLADDAYVMAKGSVVARASAAELRGGDLYAEYLGQSG